MQPPHEFIPIATCDVEMPILEREGTLDDPAGVFPRILLQVAGTKLHSRRVLLLSAFFLLISILEAVIFVRMSPSTLVVYQTPNEMTLIEEHL